MKMTNLDDAFNVEVSENPEGGCATRKDQLTNITPNVGITPVSYTHLTLPTILLV